MCHQHIHSTWQRPPTQRWEVFSLPLINPNVPYSKCTGSEGHNIHMEKEQKKGFSNSRIFHMGIYFTYPPPETMDRTENWNRGLYTNNFTIFPNANVAFSFLGTTTYNQKSERHYLVSCGPFTKHSMSVMSIYADFRGTYPSCTYFMDSWQQKARIKKFSFSSGGTGGKKQSLYVFHRNFF